MNDLISIIVPVYNSENTLRRCIRSIYSQKYKNWELILIDDGSIDTSCNICDELASSDSRIKVIHKTNEGVSAARNDGLKIANGNWITFVDSDDEIYSDFFSVVNESSSELIVCGYNKVDDSGTVKKTIKLEDSIFESKDLPSFFDVHIKDTVLTAPWCKFFKKCIIDSEQIAFRKSISSGEDTVFVAEYLQYITSIQYFSTIGYKYYEPIGDFLALRYKVTPQSAVEYATLYWHLFHNLAKNPVSEDVTCIGRFFSMEIFCLYNKEYRKDRHLWFGNKELSLIISRSKIGVVKTIWYYIAKYAPYSIYSCILKFWTKNKFKNESK